MTMEADPLAGRQPDDPNPDAAAFRDKRGADAAIVVVALGLEFRGDRAWPCRRVGAVGCLVQHRQGHGVPPVIIVRIQYRTFA